MNQPAIVKPCREKNYQEGDLFCRFNCDEISTFSPEMLNSEYWKSKNAIVGSAQGRGTTWFIEANNNQVQPHQWVLRHYYRGGLIGKLINDQYLYTGIENTRAAREFSLLQTLQALQLPAPQPVAFKVVRSGLFYRADLLSSRIENASDLVAILSKKSLTADIWKEIGVVIRSFHQHNIYHHDLNAHNLLLDEKNKVWLIDFDRGELRNNNKNWPEKNIARLYRSFKKEFDKIPNFHWSEKNWQALISGYQL